MAEVKEWLRRPPAKLGGPAPATRVERAASPPTWLVAGSEVAQRLGIRSTFSRDQYLAAVARVREYILAGDIFQANLSQRFEAPLRESPAALYQRLRRVNPAPFAAYLDLGGVQVLSASPERFLRVEGATGQVESRPIKGTRPRGTGPMHDLALGQALTESAKDRAENLMIVDLLRNDLSRVCRPGTVRAPELFALEHHPTVHHLVSTVVGQLREGMTAGDLLRAAFPGGSITGAPKVRAMEIIAELEPTRRGVYCGSIGYLGFDGSLDTSIVIRTYLIRPGAVFFQAGGGIVADSDPAEEYQETLDKARGLILLIDNYDSFVYNLARYVRELGAEPTVLRNDALSLDEVAALAPSHVIISPGPCTPTEAGISTALVRRFGAGLPILGVCLGHQCIGEAYGGRIIRAGRPMHGKTSTIRHDGTGVFAGLPSPLTATRYHSLVIAPDSLPAELRATAWSEDGEIMAVQHREHPVHGVQFHPESVLTEYGYRMLDNFLTGGHGVLVPDRADRASAPEPEPPDPPDLASAPPPVELVR
jgi:aminodeoxychorismate synthase component I